MRRLVSRQGGLTLIETMVALFIFSAVTLGVTPLLIGSIQGSAKARAYTVGKNVAVQAMERIRGLPYFESVKGVVDPTRQDVLDLYYPDMGAGYAAGKFTTTCTRTSQTPSPSAAAACPPKLTDGTSSIPENYTVKYEAEFVRPDAVVNGQQTFAVVPPTNYDWDTLATETPPAQLLRIAITASWPLGGTTRSFTLTSLIGPRSISEDKVRAEASVDFAVQSLTSYLADDGKVSTLSATAGQSLSSIETRSVSAADHETRAARLTLADEEFNGVSGAVVQDLYGAVSLLHAPADVWYAPDAFGSSQTVTYRTSPTSSSINIAFAGTTSATSTGARVGADLPGAEGNFAFTGSDPIYWVDNQASTGSRAELLLHGTRNILQIRKSGNTGITGTTKAETTALTPPGSRKVETTATARVGRLDLFPTTFIASEQRAVLAIRDFQLSLKCTSTANAGTAAVTGTWSARVKHWVDANPADGIAAGGYSPEITVSGSVSGGTEALESIQSSNPLVYDSIDNTKDVYLFARPDDPATPEIETLKGYLQDWSMNPLILSTKDGSGRATNVSLEGALQVITSPTNPAIEASALHITLGQAMCLAVDKR